MSICLICGQKALQSISRFSVAKESVLISPIRVIRVPKEVWQGNFNRGQPKTYNR